MGQFDFQSVFFYFWVWVSNSISFYFGFGSWVFWDFGSLRKESGRRTLENICTVNVADVNRVSKTRFTSGRHVEKVSTQTQSEHEN